MDISDKRKRSAAFTFFHENKSKCSWGEAASSVNVVLAKRYFRELVSGKLSKEKVAKAVAMLLQKCGNEERMAIHLTLFLHSSHPDAEEMLDEECLDRITPTCFDTSISEEDYDWFVSKLGLEPGFLYIQKECVATTLPEAEPKEIEVTTEELLEQLNKGDFSVLTSESHRTRRNDIVKLAYVDGLHTAYEKDNLSSILGSLRMRMRSISTMTGSERKAFLDEVYVATFQNPKAAVMALINTTVRIKDSCLLREVKEFLDLTIGQTNADENNAAETTILEYAIFQLLVGMDDTSPLWHFYKSGLSVLVSQEFISRLKLLQIVMNVTNVFTKNNDLGNMINVLKLFQSILKPSLEKQEVPAEELYKYDCFLKRFQHASYITDKNRNILKLRQVCIFLRQDIGKQLLDANGNLQNNDGSYSLEDRSTLELGACFVRFPFRREEIEKIVFQRAEDPNCKTFEALRETDSDVSCLISSSCHAEWAGVAEFIRILVRAGFILSP